MRAIQQSDHTAEKILGKQNTTLPQNARFLTYCMAAPVDEGLLLFNNLTKELLLLEGEEAAAVDAEDLNASPLLQQRDAELFSYLLEHWYIVPEHNDDKELCLNLRALAQHMHRSIAPKALTTFTILTTTDCNARCFYCYETSCKHEHMTSETAHKVADFIVRTCAGNEVMLRWFGGEPLYNSDVIDLICADLDRQGIGYKSFMMTNGYLFDDELIKRALDRWNLYKVQITLDGTEEVYNRRKAYIYRDGSAFTRVTDNIKRLLDNDVEVSIRLNLDEENYQDLTELTDQLAERYRGYDHLSIYPQFLLTFQDGAECRPSQGAIESLGQHIADLDRQIHALSLDRLPELPSSITIRHCIADDDASVVILPDGSLTKCQHIVDAMLCGTIDQEGPDADRIAHWKQTASDKEICAFCPLYPDCIHLTVCSEAHWEACQQVDSVRIDKYRELQEAMKARYDDVCCSKRGDERGRAA